MSIIKKTGEIKTDYVGGFEEASQSTVFQPKVSSQADKDQLQKLVATKNTSVGNVFSKYEKRVVDTTEGEVDFVMKAFHDGKLSIDAALSTVVAEDPSLHDMPATEFAGSALHLIDQMAKWVAKQGRTH